MWDSTSSHLRSYGTNSSPAGHGQADLHVETYAPLPEVHPASGRSSPFFRRALAGTGVLVLFAFGVTTASSWRTPQSEQQSKRDSSSAATESISFRAKTPLVQITDDPPPLTVTATNEYGEYDRAALVLYGIEMLVEPHRETTLSTKSAIGSEDTRFFWRVVEEVDVSATGVSAKRPLVTLHVESGPEVTVTLTTPGGVFLLTVEERSPDGTVVAVGTVTISCKHVRREIRALTESDREDFFHAMEVYFKTSTEDGQAKYGDNFFNYEKLTAFHNSALSQFCYHAGLQFLTAHAAFGLMMERSLQTVNPKVSLAFWDYMVEASTMAENWVDSDIFSDEMFGRAVGSPENSYQLTGGRLGDISSIYDPDNTLVDSEICTHHNAYGYISAINNYQDLPSMTRTSSFCNLKSHAVFATADVLFECFNAHDNLSDWEFCMEKKVHGDIHGLLGGGFNCNVDMHQFHEEHPEYNTGLLTFFLEYMTVNYWPSNSFMSDYNDCDTECTRGQTEKCGCTCQIDVFSLSDDEIYALSSDFLKTASTRYAGDMFVSHDETSDRPWGIMQDGVRLGGDETMLLLRHLAKIGCEPGANGMMAGGASPMDPIFWVLHPMFEKALHILWMSPMYRDSFDFTWVAGNCSGSNEDDPLPFTEEGLGMGSGTDFLTNADLMVMLHAGNPSLPYVFEKFSQWGTEDNWDFCPECHDASSAPTS